MILKFEMDEFLYDEIAGMVSLDAEELLRDVSDEDADEVFGPKLEQAFPSGEVMWSDLDEYLVYNLLLKKYQAKNPTVDYHKFLKEYFWEYGGSLKIIQAYDPQNFEMLKNIVEELRL